MGVINLTPDSFSDGGDFWDLPKVINRIKHLVEVGADYIDIGAESTRPGAKRISPETEWARLEPVFNELYKLDLKKSKISLDSRNAPTLIKSCATGFVSMINDVSGVQCIDTLRECLESAKAKGIRLKYCAMHMHQTPELMQTSPLCGNEAVASCETFFHTATEKLLKVGYRAQDVFVDPGIGFGKDDKANLLLINEAKNWAKRFNLLYGVSRKSFIGRLLDIDQPKLRDNPSKAFEISLAMMGASIIRTHDADSLIKTRDVIR